MAVRVFIFNGRSKALEEAYHQKDQGCRVSLGREVGTRDKWHVRAEDRSLKTGQGGDRGCCTSTTTNGTKS